MTGKYSQKTYGVGQVYDPVLGAWRKPFTLQEWEYRKRFSAELTRSLVEIPKNELSNKSQSD